MLLKKVVHLHIVNSPIKGKVYSLTPNVNYNIFNELLSVLSKTLMYYKTFNLY